MNPVEDFADLKFTVECSKITLTNAADSGISGWGPGEIWQKGDGSIQFRVHLIEGGDRLIAHHRNRNIVPGELFTDEEYFNLEALTYSGLKMNSKQILPDFRGGFPLNLSVAHGHIQEIHLLEEIPKQLDDAFVSLRVLGKLNIPANQITKETIQIAGKDRGSSMSRNVAIIKDDCFRFEVRPEREHTIVSLKLPSHDLSEATPSRIAEALQFVLGRKIEPLVIESYVGAQHEVRLISQTVTRSKGELTPPLALERYTHEDDIRKVFLSYFRYAHADRTSDWHPVSVHIGSVVSASSASLEIDILALSVAVEGLIGECFPNIAATAPGFLAELDAAKEALSKVDLSDHTISRISGALNAMKSPRKSDLLRAFIKEHRLDNRLYNSWKRLRNSSAHGNAMKISDIESVLKLRYEVLSLLYAIVLAAIGYSGQRSDYSQTGWPTVSWPVESINCSDA